jgi:amino acid transporter
VPLAALADLLNIGTLFAFLLGSVAVIVLRRTRPDMRRPIRVPFPVLHAVLALACLYLMTNLSNEILILVALPRLAGHRPGDPRRLRLLILDGGSGAARSAGPRA